ncbi:MAG TPA: NAD(P)/FAD-dependent oxidoreductase [Spirochaetota bacterium]|nr:NAD(P)/FAD-dependent oxidoreductase [Spirochaetota bacterium]
MKSLPVTKDVLIIGGGPGGLFCAASIDLPGAGVCVLEKNASPGRKLLLSGSGQCNITHGGDIESFPAHYGGRERFVKHSLFRFTNNDLVKFFLSRGLGMQEEENGKIFPVNRDASNVLRVLLDACGDNDVVVQCGDPVRSVRRVDSGFEVLTAGAVYCTRAIVIAAGGKSYPHTGSSGDGYAFASSLGHELVECVPALAPVIVKNYQFADCAGISVPGARVGLYRKGKKERQFQGDVLFTHRGLSGPGILDASRYMQPGDRITVCLTDFGSRDEVDTMLRDMISTSGKKTVKNSLGALHVPDRLVQRIFACNSIDPALTLSQMTRETRICLVENITALPFDVARTGGFNEAMVTAGGVSLGDINPKTMESRIVPGLFFAGEVLDVDGDTGGYNLQFAFSSGFAAAGGVSRFLKRTGSCSGPDS